MLLLVAKAVVYILEIDYATWIVRDSSDTYVQWAVGNIPGCDVEKGHELIKYEVPNPAARTGLHRYVCEKAMTNVTGVHLCN